MMTNREIANELNSLQKMMQAAKKKDEKDYLLGYGDGLAVARGFKNWEAYGAMKDKRRVIALSSEQLERAIEQAKEYPDSTYVHGVRVALNKAKQ